MADEPDTERKARRTRVDGEPDRRGAQPGRRGQAPHEVTHERRELVKLCVAIGMTHETIAATQFDPPISADTLTKHYGPELEYGKELALAKVAGVQFSIATNPQHKDCAKTGEFILRAKAGWRTRDEMTHRFAAGEPGSPDAQDVVPTEITVRFVDAKTTGLPGGPADDAK